MADNFQRRNLHWTLGPDVVDKYPEPVLMEIIEKAMKTMGYENQPYVVYRHNDIDREHYHIVSSRVLPNHKKVDAGNERFRLMQVMTELGKEYGFKMGRDKSLDKPVTANRQNDPVFEPGAEDKMHLLQSLFLRALKFNVKDMSQLQAVLASMNVGIRFRPLKSGGKSVLIYGMDDNKRKVTTFYSLRRQMKKDVSAMIDESFSKQGRDSQSIVLNKINIGVKSAYCRKHSTSAEEYVYMMRQLGVDALFVRNSTNAVIKRVVCVDTSSNTILDSDAGQEIDTKVFREMEAGHKWMSKKNGERRHISDEQKEEIVSMIERKQGEYLGRGLTPGDGGMQYEGESVSID